MKIYLQVQIQKSNSKNQNDSPKFKIYKKFWILISLRGPLRVCSFAFCILHFAFLSGCQAKKPLYKHSELLMGTVVEITAESPEAANIAFEEIRNIEDILSHFKEDSDISKLNREGEARVSFQTLKVIKKSIELHRLTEGAFDITIQPLVELWNLAKIRAHPPRIRSIRQKRALLGAKNIIIDEENLEVRLALSGMKLNLGAIAKGYAVDRAVKRLRESRIKSCLINAGGDIYALGRKGQEKWRVGVRAPDGSSKIIDYIELENQAVATSGNYEQYFILQDRKFGHIISPFSGYPVDNEIASVSVVAYDCTTADALATAIFVLGKEKGEELAKRFRDVEVKIITKKDLKDVRGETSNR